MIPSLHVGGAESQLFLILPALKSRGWDITVFLTSGVGELAAPLEKLGIQVVTPKFMHIRKSIKNRILRMPLLLISFFQLTLYLLKNRPQIVNFTLAEAYLLGSLCCLLTGQKNLVMNRRSLNNYQHKYPLLAKIEHKLHTRMRVIITNSKSTIEQLAILEKVDPKKLQLIYNGLDMRRFNNQQHDHTAIRQLYKLPPSSLTFIVIANILPYKGHATLLQALNAIQTQLPTDWQLLCVGKKYAYCNELQQQAQDLNIQSHVYFLGQQDSVEQFLAISNIAISCSYEEGFSNAVLEAQAAGLPIIVTNVGGNPEAVIANQTGLVIPPKNATALSEAILKLIEDPSEAAAMASLGKKRIEDEFSLHTCVAHYDKLYSDLVNDF